MAHAKRRTTCSRLPWSEAAAGVAKKNPLIKLSALAWRALDFACISVAVSRAFSSKQKTERRTEAAHSCSEDLSAEMWNCVRPARCEKCVINGRVSVAQICLANL